MMEISFYGFYLCTLPDTQAVDMAERLAQIYFERTGSFADVVAVHTMTKKKYLPSEEIKKSLQVKFDFSPKELGIK